VLTLGEVHWRVTVGEEKPQYFDSHITEEDIGMPRDTLVALVGNGQARVTCSVGLKDADYGNGFEAFCSVQLTCNQDQDTVAAAQVLALELVESRVADAFEVAHGLFERTGPHPQAASKRRK
jgi:uncharacterized protein YhfF